MVQSKRFELKRDEVTGWWRKLHNEELHYLYSFPSIIRMIKSRKMRWVAHVAKMGEGRVGVLIGYWWEIWYQIHHWEARMYVDV
jgi:hypothetical protein